VSDRVVVPVETAHGSYQVRIGGGALHDLADRLAEVAPAHRYVVIADEAVARLHGGRLAEALPDAGARADVFTFPAGEKHKNRHTWAELSDRMFSIGVGRDSAVLAFGGGVTGDLAGFVAATYMRGLPVVQIPTTLLAMIDSSVGGKTGVDTPAGKNLIGAFLQPRLVIADTDLLHTLSPAELRSGLAEGIKAGAIADAEFFRATAGSLRDILQLEPNAVRGVVERSVRIKADVVGLDETESGPRKILNFGHTVGHAVEALSGFRLLHGEAIAIGMVAEARIGEILGVTERGTAELLADVLARAGLPTSVPGEYSGTEILEATRSDKKARRGKVEYSLIARIGSAEAGPTGRWGVPVDDRVVLKGLSRPS
jgi:3-dehydroquinate synthase